MDNVDPTREPTFLSRATPSGAKASPLLWSLAVLTFVAYLGFQWVVSGYGNKPLPEALGRAIGLALLPLLVVALSQASRWNRNQKTRVTVFFLASLALLIVALVAAIALTGYATFVKGSGV